MDAFSQLLKYLDSDNIANELDDELLLKIGDQVIEGYELDKKSRAEWENTIDKAMEIARQVITHKTDPWEGCANVKFPLLAVGAIQFAARTYPELVKDGSVVQATVNGLDPDGSRAARAKRISSYMSYQLLEESESWEEETDKLLIMLPIIGTVFRKTYYDSINKHNCSELCNPQDIVIHNSARSLETARRVSHRLLMYSNDILERINAGIYSDIDIKLLGATNVDPKLGVDEQDPDKLNEAIEQHTYWDLDGDGYKEPYIITVHKESRKVLRIKARFDLNGIRLGKDNKIISIKAINYFTDYHFIPSPDGSFYSLGFGTLLYPINESINSVFNQLLDAGSLNNLQSGFIGGGIRIQGGRLTFKPGEWKKIDTIGTAIQDNVYPLPVKEPSQTLFNLLQLLIQTGKELTGVIDILPDDQQTQNVPATTIVSLLDQRLKPLKAVFKRIYRSFKKEFDKLYYLNSVYLPDQKIYFTILNEKMAIAKQDFHEPDYTVKPIADPSMSSESQRILKVELLRGALAQPGGQLLNPTDVMTRWVNEINMPNPQQLIAPPQQPTPSKEQLDFQIKSQQNQNDMQKATAEFSLKQQELQLKAQELQNRKELDDAKSFNLHAKSMLDIANSHREHYQKVAEHAMKMLDMNQDVQLQNRKLDIEEKKVNNDNTQSTTGMASSSSQ